MSQSQVVGSHSPKGVISADSAPESSAIIAQRSTSKSFRKVNRDARIAGEAYITCSLKQIPAKQQPSNMVCKDYEFTVECVHREWRLDCLRYKYH